MKVKDKEKILGMFKAMDVHFVEYETHVENLENGNEFYFDEESGDLIKIISKGKDDIK